MPILTFEEPDLVAFPALRLAKESLVAGASHLVALNAANEVFVEKFLQKQLRFVEISDKLATVLDNVTISNSALQDEASLLAYDQSIRLLAQKMI